MRIILGQTLTSRGSEGGGSRALGEVHADVRDEKKEADAKFLMPVINKYLVWPLVLFNFGPNARPPLWTIKYEPQKDLTSIAGWLEKVVQMVPVPASHVRQTFQIPEPAEGEEIVTVPSPVGAADDIDSDDEADPDDDSADFEEPPVPQKKTPLSARSPATRSKHLSSRKERFARLRPSTIQSSKN